MGRPSRGPTDQPGTYEIPMTYGAISTTVDGDSHLNQPGSDRAG